MEIKKAALAGTLESSDAQVRVEPSETLKIHIESSVKNQYGRKIKATVEESLKKLNVTKGHIFVVDKGALDCTIKARVDAAVFRSNDASTNHIPWEEL